MPGCGCGGGTAPKALTVKTNGHTASVVERAAVPGMPRYKVSDSTQGTKTFDTYNEARLFAHEHGGRLRAL
jgi:hypothetical protein